LSLGYGREGRADVLGADQSLSLPAAFAPSANYVCAVELPAGTSAGRLTAATPFEVERAS